jgi:hypothetical protein
MTFINFGTQGRKVSFDPFPFGDLISDCGEKAGRKSTSQSGITCKKQIVPERQ